MKIKTLHSTNKKQDEASNELINIMLQRKPLITYRVKSGYCPLLERLDLSNLPINLIDLPEGVDYIDIVFDDYQIKSIRVLKISNVLILLSHDNNNGRGGCFLSINLDSRTVSESIAALDSKLYQGALSDAKQLITLVGALGFMSDSHSSVFFPDILAKDLPAYADAKAKNDLTRIRTIEQRAIRRKGYVMRTDRFQFEAEGEYWSKNPDIEASLGGRGSEKAKAYLRQGHFRWQACGKNWLNRKVIWIAPVICRQDLMLSA